MIRWLLVRFLIPLFVILILRSVIMAIARTFSAVMHSQAPESMRASDSASAGELKKDPVCGTYVSPGAAVSQRISGEMVHFCSVACRDKYRAP